MKKAVLFLLILFCAKFANAASNMRDDSGLRSVVVGDLSLRLIAPGNSSVRNYGSTINNTLSDSRDCYLCSCSCFRTVTCGLMIVGAAAFFATSRLMGL